MSDVLLLYLWTRLDALQVLIGVSLFVTALFAFVTSIAAAEGDELGQRWAIRSIALAVFFALAAVAVPSSKDMALIVAGKFSVDVVRSEEAQRLIALAQKVIEKQLKKAAE